MRSSATQRSRAALRSAAAALGAALLVALCPAAALACEPCGSRLDLPRSLEKAGLVAVVRRPEGARPLDDRDNNPPCDELLVERVLKGEFGGERLWVRSFYGMCPYGIILGAGRYVVLLAKPSAEEHDFQAGNVEGECKAALDKGEGFYAAVGMGCAVKALAVEGGSVEAEGVKMTLEEFRDKYGLRGAEQPSEGAAAFRRLGAWPGGYFGAGLFGPAAAFREVTQ